VGAAEYVPALLDPVPNDAHAAMRAGWTQGDAVLSFGGFLGIGDSYHPLPWKSLKYDPSQGGYVVDLDKDRLQGAPSYSSSEAPDWSDPGYSRRIDDYYGRFPGI